MADGRFLYKNSPPRDAGKYIPIYYGEICAPQDAPVKGARIGAVIKFRAFNKFSKKCAKL